MSSGGGEVGELVKERVQIQRTPAANASVQAGATLADFAPWNNVRRSCGAFLGAAERRGKSLPDPTVISAFYEPKSMDGGVHRGALRAGSRRCHAVGVARARRRRAAAVGDDLPVVASRSRDRLATRAAGAIGAAWRMGARRPDRRRHMTCGILRMSSAFCRLSMDSLCFPALWSASPWARSFLTSSSCAWLSCGFSPTYLSSGATRPVSQCRESRAARSRRAARR